MTGPERIARGVMHEDWPVIEAHWTELRTWIDTFMRAPRRRDPQLSVVVDLKREVRGRVTAAPCPTVRSSPSMRGTAAERLDPHMRISGTVAFFNNAKGFGFIKPDDGGNDVFVHASAVEASAIEALGEGDRVSFVLEDDRRSGKKRAAQLQKA